MQGYELAMHIVCRLAEGSMNKDERMDYLVTVTSVAARLARIESVPVARWNELSVGIPQSKAQVGPI